MALILEWKMTCLLTVIAYRLSIALSEVHKAEPKFESKGGVYYSAESLTGCSELSFKLWFSSYLLSYYLRSAMPLIF